VGKVVGAIHRSPQAFRGEIDGGIQIPSDGLNHLEGQSELRDLDAAALVDATLLAIFVAHPHQHPLDTVSPAGKDAPQAPPDMLPEGICGAEAGAPDLDSHPFTPLRSRAHREEWGVATITSNL
jgi:hypothetical protein